MIIKLPENISNQIAAGEVVERPASVVKELVENSIDAGATKISVEIVNAGKDLIKVIDNGKGIESSDIELLFERHATSKIKTLDDIYSIYSLGFRGEALASIASVSRVIVVSKTTDDDNAKKVTYYDNKIQNIDTCSGIVGTSISVSDIFYNTPVRYKFLETSSREKSKILALMTRLSISRPDIAFTMIIDGKEEFRTDGSGKLFNVLHRIYGASLSSKIIEFNSDNDLFKISGYISKPEYTKGSKALQVLFVNGRYVESKDLSKAIVNAYEGLLMVHRHPAYFINIDMPADSVDVNIHPQKIEIKLENFDAISTKLFNLVKETLYKYKQVRTFDVEKIAVAKEEVKKEEILSDATKKIFEKNMKNNSDIDFYIPNLEEDESKLETVDLKYLDMLNDFKFSDETVEVSEDKEVYEEISFDNDVDSFEDVIDISDENDSEEVVYNEPEKYDENIYSNLDVVGQLFKTFIITQKDDVSFFIDQHAAHERVMFERFMAEFRNQSFGSQYLISPYEYEFKFDDLDIIDRAIGFLENLRVDVEKINDRKYKFTSVPVFEMPLEIDDIVNILDNFKDNFEKSFELLLKPKITMRACKSAVKAGDTLSKEEISELINSLKSLNNPMTCPHGRPIMFEITKKEFEKLFKRIV